MTQQKQTALGEDVARIVSDVRRAQMTIYSNPNTPYYFQWVSEVLHINDETGESIDHGHYERVACDVRGGSAYLGYERDAELRVDADMLARVLLNASARQTLVTALGRLGMRLETREYHADSDSEGVEFYEPEDNELAMGLDSLEEYSRPTGSHGSADACVNALLLIECVRLHTLARYPNAMPFIPKYQLRADDGSGIFNELTHFYDELINNHPPKYGPQNPNYMIYKAPSPEFDAAHAGAESADLLLSFAELMEQFVVDAYIEAYRESYAPVDNDPGPSAFPCPDCHGMPAPYGCDTCDSTGFVPVEKE